MDEKTLETIGSLKADNASIKEDLKELKENQKPMLEFIAEQKAGRKFIWLFFGVIAGIAAFFKDVINAFYNLFNYH